MFNNGLLSKRLKKETEEGRLISKAKIPWYQEYLTTEKDPGSETGCSSRVEEFSKR